MKQRFKGLYAAPTVLPNIGVNDIVGVTVGVIDIVGVIEGVIQYL
jgi:hypothetical protein